VNKVNLNVEKSLRNRMVRITGTRYTPLDIPLLIQDNLEKMYELINDKENVYEKALLAVILISYLQPFEDGNKRTARLTANAVLMAYNLCPLSYRSVNPSDYKKAMLLFYEHNHIQAFIN
jgi:Fic family protein